MFGIGRKKKREPISVEDENNALRKRLHDMEETSRKQSDIEDRKLKLLNMQMRDYKRQERKDNRAKMTKTFRRTVERMATKPVTREQNRELLSGAKAMKSMFGVPKNKI